MWQRSFGWVGVVCALSMVIASLPEDAVGAPLGQEVSDELLSSAPLGSKTVTCAFLKESWQPGTITKDGLFVSDSKLLAYLKKQLKKPATRSFGKMVRQMASLKKQRQARRGACNTLPPLGDTPVPTPTAVASPLPTAPSGTPVVTPTPGATPTVTATPSGAPTATPSTTIFDADGNVTSYGKTVLQIPINLSASKSAGQQVWQSKCVTCHTSEKQGRTFVQYRTSVSAPPMNITIVQLPDTSLANLTAYLNRTR